MVKDPKPKTIYEVGLWKIAMSVYIFIGGLIVVWFNSKIGLGLLFIGLSLWTWATIQKRQYKKKLEIGSSPVSSIDQNSKIYQTVVQLLGPQWYYALKYYSTEAMATNPDLLSLAERDQTFREAWSEFSDSYKKALEYFRSADVTAGSNEISLAENSLTKINNTKAQNIYRHFLGFMEALRAKADNRTATNIAFAKEILSKTKGTLDTPEWHHFYAVLEHQDGNMDEFQKHIEIAKKLTYEREPDVEKRIKDGLELNTDITETMLGLCRDALEEG